MAQYIDTTGGLQLATSVHAMAAKNSESILSAVEVLPVVKLSILHALSDSLFCMFMFRLISLKWYKPYFCFKVQTQTATSAKCRSKCRSPLHGKHSQEKMDFFFTEGCDKKSCQFKFSCIAIDNVSSSIWITQSTTV